MFVWIVPGVQQYPGGFSLPIWEFFCVFQDPGLVQAMQPSYQVVKRILSMNLVIACSHVHSRISLLSFTNHYRHKKCTGDNTYRNITHSLAHQQLAHTVEPLFKQWDSQQQPSYWVKTILRAKRSQPLCRRQIFCHNCGLRTNVPL